MRDRRGRATAVDHHIAPPRPPLRARAAQAGDPDVELTPQERKAGWIWLFDGSSLDGWKTSSGQPSRVPVEGGSINPHGCGGYMMIHEKTWSDFVLALDFKISQGCNSGIF